MSSPCVEIHEHRRLEDAEHRFRRQFIDIAVWSAVAMTLFGAGLYGLHQTLPAAATALLMALTSCMLIWLKRRIDRGNVRYAGSILYTAVLSAGILGALLMPEILPATIISPIIAVVYALPYVNARQLRPIILIAWLSAFLMVFLAEQVRLLPSSPWVAGAPLMVAAAYCTGLVLLLTWRYHERLTGSLIESQQANEELRATRTDLEVMVANRTADLQEREARFRAISELTSDYTFIIEVGQRVRAERGWMTDALHRITGYTPEELDQRGGFIGIVINDDLQVARQAYRRLLSNSVVTSEFRIQHAEGAVRWLRAYARPEWSEEQQRVVRAVGALQDVTDRKHYEQRIEQLAFYDQLTGLGNRALFQEQAATMLAQSGSVGAVLFLDLDRFKSVNDTLGHEIGDALLSQVAKKMIDVLPKHVLLTRFGGDEFALFVPDGAQEEAVAVAQLLLEAINISFLVESHVLRVSGSVGIACAPQHGSQISEILKHADIAMYHAKRHNSRIGVYEPSLSFFLSDRLRLESDLRIAIDQQQLVLHFQPICDIRTGAIHHVEGLVRWEHPLEGLIAPIIFIPLAEECGLIRQIDRWVINTALHQIAEWDRLGCGFGMSINLSVHSLNDHDLLDYLTTCLQQSGARAEHIIIEVTESTAMADVKRSVRVLQEMKSLGFRIALDDFGVSYSSLSRLKHLPIDILKIDREFVSGIGHNPQDEKMLAAFGMLGQGLGLEITAEGVETTEQRVWLQFAGYPFAQGYLFGRPMTATSMLSTTRSQCTPQSTKTSTS